LHPAVEIAERNARNVSQFAMNRWKRIKKIFSEALELEGPERSRFVEAECSDDKEMMREVLSLLQAHEDTGVLDRQMDEMRMSAISEARSAFMKGEVIGRYRILHELGHGGMGSVFLAERMDGEFDQKVALKLLRNAFATDHQVQRFLSERQILATLDHDQIARLLDGGVTDDGRPWFAMEPVDGIPITEYCDSERLNVMQRLELFLEVCEAVSYAHRNLVIHRDLKPSNIFVKKSGKVKLLDFGIAKIIRERESEPELTRPGMLPYTPSYASPEQVRGESVTTASDVYQLGLILYELLAGLPPYDISGKTPSALEDTICNRVPPHPAVQLVKSHSNKDPEQISRQRSVSVRKLKKELIGEVGTIVMKAIRKEPERRYESAGQLADDIRRFLSGKPVKAHADSRIYRFGKFLRRHPAGSVSVASIILMAVVYLVTLTWHQQQIRAALDQAEQEAEKSARVIDFMLGMFEAGEPRENPGDMVTARELLERGLEEAAMLDAQPEVQATMYNVIGKVYSGLGRYDDAVQILTKAVDIERERTGKSDLDIDALAEYLIDLANARVRQGHFGEARGIFQLALTLLTDKHGESHPRVAEAKLAKGFWISVAGMDNAAELRMNALDIRKEWFGENHPATAEAYLKAGQIKRSQGKPEAAIEMFQQALNIRKNLLGEDHTDVQITRFLLADIYRLFRIDLLKAEQLYREGLKVLAETMGENHHSRLHGITSLASLLVSEERHSEAAELYLENLKIRNEVFGEFHPSVAEGLGQAGMGFREMGYYEESEMYHRKSLVMWKQLLDEDHTIISGAMTGLAETLIYLGKYDEAESLLLRALEIQQLHFGEESGARVYALFGKLEKTRGSSDEAIRFYTRSIDIFESHGSGGHYDLIEIRNELARLKVMASGSNGSPNGSSPFERQ
jgi:eukaryotic-like serine/threonine-protein kinase